MAHFRQQLGLIAREFYPIRGFPKVLCCVDGTHINIKRPTMEEYAFVNGKG